MRFCDPLRQCREGPLKAAPTPKGPMDTGCNEKRTQKLTQTGMEYPKLSLVQLMATKKGLTLGSALHQKKTGKGMPGETPCLSPCGTWGLLCSYPVALQQQRNRMKCFPALSAKCFAALFALQRLCFAA